jgi:hypothetical protein
MKGPKQRIFWQVLASDYRYAQWDSFSRGNRLHSSHARFSTLYFYGKAKAKCSSVTDEASKMSKWLLLWRFSIAGSLVVIAAVTIATWKPISDAIRTGTVLRDLLATTCSYLIATIAVGFTTMMKDRRR